MRPFVFLFFLAALVTLGACKFNPNIQGRGTGYVQGEWNEDRVKYQEKLLQYTNHHFTFTCDSFYAVLTTTSKTNQYADSCFNNGRWNEYAKGVYVIQHDTLFVSGTFTHVNYKQKLSGCYRIGQYLPKFIVKKHTADSLVLQNLQDHLPVILILQKKLACTPKPL